MVRYVGRASVTVAAGQRSLLREAATGERVIDLCSGEGAAILGYQPRSVVSAVRQQLCRDAHGRHRSARRLGARLAMKLRAIAGMPGAEVVPATTGSEAADLAVRLCRRVTGRPLVAHLRNSYHGSTSATMSLCGIASFRRRDKLGASLELAVPDTPDQERASQWERSKLRLRARSHELAAIILEPVRSNAGFRMLSRQCAAWLRRFCDQHGIILIADEVTSGLGRCGAWLSAELVGIRPDIVVLGKSLGAGVAPIGAAIVPSDIWRAARGPGYRSTLSWSPPACAAAIATLRAITRGKLVERSARLGESIHRRLGQLAPRTVTDLVGCGLGWGIQLGRPRDQTADEWRAHAYLRLLARGLHVEPSATLPGLRMMPPLTIPHGVLMRAIDAIAEELDQVASYKR